ncbi:hypothetical protein E2C01_007545 [Portunus trituberculatus]|uniref:Uncharacterized protein n=1 Tax=Portunus trituberculatus TaxID=210409 RepID=A0A5B7CZA6_PORTR|nr:hypothetical protein [Portunus trituberculatus]
MKEPPQSLQHSTLSPPGMTGDRGNYRVTQQQVTRQGVEFVQVGPSYLSDQPFPFLVRVSKGQQYFKKGTSISSEPFF